MRKDAVPDLSRLALLAQDAHADLRPLLLRIQTQAFVSAQSRRGTAVRDYEAIALGLIPLVTDDVLAEAAALLRTVEDAPAAVLEALAARLGHPDRSTARLSPVRAGAIRLASLPGLERSEVDRLVALQAEEVDLALAGNDGLRLDGHALAALVERAVTRAGLARRLLARSEPGILDRAALYRFADGPIRAAIRQALGDHLARSTKPRSAGERGAAERLGGLALGRRPEVLWPFIAAELRLPPGQGLDLEEESGRECFVLALRALDMPPADCVALLLALDWPRARSVRIVHELAAIARSTSCAAAFVLVGADHSEERPVAEAHELDARERVDRERRRRSALARRNAEGPAVSVAPAGRGPTRIAQAGHRSRSTTGPDRT